MNAHVQRRLDDIFKLYQLLHTQQSTQHNWEDLCTQLNHQQTRTRNKLNKREAKDSIRLLMMLHHRFANATHVSLCKSNRWENGEHEKHPPTLGPHDHRFLRVKRFIKQTNRQIVARSACPIISILQCT